MADGCVSHIGVPSPNHRNPGEWHLSILLVCCWVLLHPEYLPYLKAFSCYRARKLRLELTMTVANTMQWVSYTSVLIISLSHFHIKTHIQSYLLIYRLIYCLICSYTDTYTVLSVHIQTHIQSTLFIYRLIYSLLCSYTDSYTVYSAHIQMSATL